MLSTPRASVVSTLSSPNPPSNVLTIIMRTEPTLQRMLRTLDSDYSKIQVRYWILYPIVELMSCIQFLGSFS